MSLKAILIEYLGRIRGQRATSNSTSELSFREHLCWLFGQVVVDFGKPANFTNEPITGAHVTGRPDFAVTRGLQEIGFVEAEAVDADLDRLAGHAKQQNERFRDNLHNFLLTNHFDFVLFADTKRVLRVTLPVPPEHGRITLSDSVVEEFRQLFDRFLDSASPPAATAEAIATQLARRARLLRFAAGEMLKQEDSPLHPYWHAYQQTLYPDMEAEKFADVYAQTFVYGLFMTWLNTSTDAFTRAFALRHLPTAIPPIRTLLRFGGGEDLPEELIWIVDGLCADLDASDPAAALKPMADGRDPMIHWYETFLAAFDPKQRERVGVYYTPDAVVGFNVRAVDGILRSRFDKATGLADPSVILLDPATGTGTFLAHAYKKVHGTMMDRNEAGQWPDRARDHLAVNFHGFELLPAAYTLAHIKLRHVLEELGAGLPITHRLPVYLTNSLEEGVRREDRLPFTGVLAEEANRAAQVKKNAPVLVVLGNPPYSGHSANPSKDAQGNPTFIGKLIAEYQSVDGQPLGERNPKWLQDD